MSAAVCEAWTSHDDVTGEGQQTFYHECGQERGHPGKHTCIGEPDRWAEDGWSPCGMEW